MSGDFGMNILEKVYSLIEDRKTNPIEGSYTNYLQQKGVDKICKKVGEEAAEVIIGAKNVDKDEVTYEVADLMFHVLVLISELDITPQDVFDELEKRYNK